MDPRAGSGVASVRQWQAVKRPARGNAMMKLRPFFLTFAMLAFGLAWPVSDTFAAAQPIFWSALRPVDQAKATVPLSGKAVSGPQGETLAWHDEEHPVDLTGFVLPIDQDGDLVYEFMLVPWAGACSHMPSPPPNQLVRAGTSASRKNVRDRDRDGQPAAWPGSGAVLHDRRRPHPCLRLQHQPCRGGESDGD